MGPSCTDCVVLGVRKGGALVASDDYQAIVVFCKYASILATALFGAFGLFGDTWRDGSLTIFGKVALIGFLLSATIGLATQAGESRIERVKAAADKDKEVKEREHLQNELAWQTKTLSSIQRQLYAFSSLRIKVHLIVPRTSPLFKKLAGP